MAHEAQETNVEELPLITLTKEAAKRVRGILEEEDNKDSKLRVFVSGGGCSGFQYGFTLDSFNDGDTVVVQHGITIVIDPMSYPYLIGAEIGYNSGLDGAQFVIKNPNASATCGCGSSFSA
jgi:iron-sulfur cluster insertion protein